MYMGEIFKRVSHKLMIEDMFSDGIRGIDQTMSAMQVYCLLMKSFIKLIIVDYEICYGKITNYLMQKDHKWSKPRKGQKLKAKSQRSKIKIKI